MLLVRLVNEFKNISGILLIPIACKSKKNEPRKYKSKKESFTEINPLLIVAIVSGIQQIDKKIKPPTPSKS